MSRPRAGHGPASERFQPLRSCSGSEARQVVAKGAGLIFAFVEEAALRALPGTHGLKCCPARLAAQGPAQLQEGPGACVVGATGRSGDLVVPQQAGLDEGLEHRRLVRWPQAWDREAGRSTRRAALFLDGDHAVRPRQRADWLQVLRQHRAACPTARQRLRRQVGRIPYPLWQRPSGLWLPEALHSLSPLQCRCRVQVHCPVRPTWPC
mmetsp:Transcript_36786/g.117090  ORF Transcript_36786/g.117090 Transcript_36786/m.117090 type:complete len:208 (+) Transcript_36786:235-858(+)